MTDIDVKSFLEDRYNAAMKAASGKLQTDSRIEKRLKKYLDTIVEKSGSRIGVFTVLISSTIYKCLHPEQDVRCHQSQIPNGYSGRTFDTNFVTPFLTEKKFPSMKESGWLTRSLEQASPYTLDFNGKITPKELKVAFLNILHSIEEQNADPKLILDYLLQSLIIQRDLQQIQMAVPQNLSINNIMNLLDKHFYAKYSAHGASRLPVLALYAVCQCLTTELKRYNEKKLLPLESHTSADKQSGRMGDIDIVNSDNSPFEAVEVKFEIPITHEIVECAKNKILTSKISRYYILSTAESKESDRAAILRDVQQIKNVHGCQLVINGIMPSLKYYLRLIDDLTAFIENYTSLLVEDKSVLFEHRAMWNKLVAEL